MLAVLLLLLVSPQASVAAPQTGADGTSAGSVLAEPCSGDAARDSDILVCASRQSGLRLPLPDERPPPNRPLPSNPDKSGIGALRAEGSPCATRSEGCTTGVDLFGGATFLVRAAGKLIDPDSCCEEPGEATNPVALINDIGGVLGIGRKEKVVGTRMPIPLDDLPAVEPAPRSPPSPG